MRPISGGETIEPIVPGLEGGTNWFPMAYNPSLATSSSPPIIGRWR